MDSQIFLRNLFIRPKEEREYPCYRITKKGCEFIANKLTGTKGTESTARYVMGEELYSKPELDKKVNSAETERDNYKKRAEAAEETLKGFDGKDIRTITRERDEWKRKWKYNRNAQMKMSVERMRTTLNM